MRNEVTYPPWTPEQVQSLRHWQTSGHCHPFTCGVCRDNYNIPRAEYELTPTINGWICETCDYTQDWAYDFMLVFNPLPSQFPHVPSLRPEP